MANVTFPRNGVPIGFVTIDGQRYAVDVGGEYLRAFESLVDRVGGPTGVGTDDLLLSQFEDAGIEESKAQISALRDEFGMTPAAAPTASGTMFRPWSAQSIDLQEQIRGSGTSDPGLRGFWPDDTGGANVHRLRDRVLVGGGAAFTGNRVGTQNGFVPNATAGANWAPRDSAFFSASDKGLIQIAGFVSNANIDTTAGLPTESIAIGGFAIGNKAARSVWGLYSDVQFEVGSYAYGIEIAMKNKTGASNQPTSYNMTATTIGIWMPAGGDSSYGGSPTAPNDAAIGIGTSSTSAQTWNVGILFDANSLTRDGSGYAYAMEMADSHILSWRATGNNPILRIYSDHSLSGRLQQWIAKSTGMFVINNASKTAFTVAIDPAGINYIEASNVASGAPAISAKGDDTNIDLSLVSKGTGNIRFGTHTVNADAPVVGYITIKDSGGTTRKLACIA